MMDEREFTRLREAYAVAAKLSDLGDKSAAYTYLSTKVLLFLSKWTEEQERRDTWADEQEIRFFARAAAAEQPSYQ